MTDDRERTSQEDFVSQLMSAAGQDEGDLDQGQQGGEQSAPQPAPAPTTDAPQTDPQQPGQASQQPAQGQGEAPQGGQAGQQPYRVPLKELLDEREARHAAERQAQEALRAYQEMVRRQQEAAQQAQQPLDPLMDPQGFQAAIDQRLQQTVQAIQQEVQERFVNNSMRRAHRQHGEKFDEAYQALLQSGNQPLIQRILADDDPGETLMDWYGRRRAIQEIGPDPAAYRQRLEEQLINDPAFRQRVIEAARQQALQPGNGTQRPATVTELPPSLNRAPTAARGEEADMGDDGQFFARNVGRRR